jgi:rare lipoprotein A
MSINLVSGFYGRFNSKIYYRRLMLLIFTFSFINGCAADPVLQINDTLASLPTNAKKAAYNNPYKIKGKKYSPLHTAIGYQASGKASWYGTESGNRTANGMKFNPKALTAAHRTLPIPSKVRVTNLSNGRYVDVVVNDRGPFRDGKLIDLSQEAAKQIGMRGVTEVKVEYLDS